MSRFSFAHHPADPTEARGTSAIFRMLQGKMIEIRSLTDASRQTGRWLSCKLQFLETGNCETPPPLSVCPNLWPDEIQTRYFSEHGATVLGGRFRHRQPYPPHRIHFVLDGHCFTPTSPQLATHTETTASPWTQDGLLSMQSESSHSRR